MMTGLLKRATLTIAVLTLIAGCSGQDGSGTTVNDSNPFALEAEPASDVAANRKQRAARPTSGRPERPGNPPRKGKQTAAAVRASRSAPRSATADARSDDLSATTVVDSGEPVVANTPSQSRVQEHPLVGQTAPVFQLGRLDGTLFRLEDHQTRDIVVVDFWTTWCKPCVEAFPVLEGIAADYRNVGVEFCSVNVEQDSHVVRDFLTQRRLQGGVALDLEGKVADSFDVETFPTLVLIDKEGMIRRVHVGEVRNLNAILRGELDALLDGKELAAIPVLQSDEDAAHPQAEVAGSARLQEDVQHEPAEYLLHLSSGREIDVGEIFRQDGRDYQQRLATAMRGSRHVRINYDDGSPSVLVGQLGGRLHGPTAAFYDTGRTMAFLNFSRGKRDGTVFTWDSESRPVVFEQYENGKRDGIRCLFKACCPECKDGHIWLVEEWSDDELVHRHLVPDDGQPVTLGADGSGGSHDRPTGEVASSTEDPESSVEPIEDAHASIEDELQEALNELADYEKTLDQGERQLQQSLANFNRIQARRQRAARAQARAKAARRGGFAMRSRGLRIRACFT